MKIFISCSYIQLKDITTSDYNTLGHFIHKSLSFTTALVLINDHMGISTNKEVIAVSPA